LKTIKFYLIKLATDFLKQPSYLVSERASYDITFLVSCKVMLSQSILFIQIKLRIELNTYSHIHDYYNLCFYQKQIKFETVHPYTT